MNSRAALMVVCTSVSALAADPPSPAPAQSNVAQFPQSAPAAAPSPAPGPPYSAPSPAAPPPADQSPPPASTVEEPPHVVPPAAGSASAPPAAAQFGPVADDPYEDSGELDAPESNDAPKLAASTGFGAALEGYGGLALLVGAGPTRSRAVVGGLLRLRYHYFQMGGSIEVSDSGSSGEFREEEHWRTVQGFAGAFLPFDHFVDLDASIGYAQRTYINSDRDYGPDGLRAKSSALALRFGISDRTSKKRVGARIGAALLGTIDFGDLTIPYSRQSTLPSGEIATTRGTTDVGGFSLALVVNGAFELGGRPGLAF